MATSHMRGHIIYCTDGKNWFYMDNNLPVDAERPCVRCGKMHTVEGYDACLGHVRGAASACCGHGVEKPFVIYNKKEVEI